jgi:PAS domain-containing protein
MKVGLWVVYSGGGLLAWYGGGSTGRTVYLVAVVLALTVFRRPLVIGLTDLASRFGETQRQVEKMPRKTDYDVAPKEDADRWRQNDLRVVNGERAEFEETGTDRDGRPYVNLSVKFPLADESGTAVEICGISTDITDRKRAEESLKLTQTSIDGAAEMVAWFTSDGNVYYVNDATCRTLGYSRDELLRMTALDFSAGKDLRRHPEMAGTRIVALTGWGQVEDRQRTADAGFDDHLTKPAHPDQIQRILEDVARRMA